MLAKKTTRELFSWIKKALISCSITTSRDISYPGLPEYGSHMYQFAEDSILKIKYKFLYVSLLEPWTLERR